MKIFLTIFWIVIGFLVLWIFSINLGQLVNINLFFTSFENIELITVALISIFVGFVLGMIIFVLNFIKVKKEKYQLTKYIKSLEAKIVSLNQDKTTELQEENPKKSTRQEDLPDISTES